MSWITVYNDVFFISIATLTFSFLGVVIKSMLASKCDNVNICCGLIKIHRAVELEVEQQQQNHEKVSNTFLSSVDNVVDGICRILSTALIPNGFIGPALLGAWWNFFVRKLQPSSLLKELDRIEKEIWKFPQCSDFVVRNRQFTRKRDDVFRPA